MERTSDGRIRYALAFQDAPWRDGELVTVDAPLDVDDSVEIPDGDERGTWRVGDVWEATDGEPDTVVIWKPTPGA